MTIQRLVMAFTAILVAFLAGCSSSPAPSVSAVDAHPATLAGTSWSVVAVAGRAPVSGWEPSVTFTPTIVSGSDGCNQFDGTYRYDGTTGQLAIDDSVSITKMACANRDPAFQVTFLRALIAATDASLDGHSRLILSGARGQLGLVVGR